MFVVRFLRLQKFVVSAFKTTNVCSVRFLRLQMFVVSAFKTTNVCSPLLRLQMFVVCSVCFLRLQMFVRLQMIVVSAFKTLFKTTKVCILYFIGLQKFVIYFSDIL
jgi:hypothetical protein